MALYEESYVYLLNDGKLQRQEVKLARRESDRVYNLRWSKDR